MNDTVSSVLLKILKKHDIRHVFGLPAAQLGLVMDGASRDPYFSYVTTRHEEAAGHMAHAIARVTDSMAVCFGTVGPGAMNMVPGVAAAWADNIPLLALTANNQSWTIDPGRDLLQNAEHIAVYKPITKWNAVIRSPERAGELVERALHVARSGKPGPVHLDIPCDIGTSACAHVLDSLPTLAPARPVPGPADMDRVVAMLSEARRPVLIAGGGVARSGATEAFRELIKLTGFPATTTPNAQGAVPKDCATHIGSGGMLAGSGAVRALREADTVLAIGCKFSSWTLINKPPVYPVVEGQRVIQVDIDDDSLGKNAPLALGLVGDARAFLELLNQALADTSFERDDSWVRAVVDEYQTYRAQVEEMADATFTKGTGILNEAAVSRAVSRQVPEDAIIVFDGGQTMEWTQTFIQPRDPHSFVFNPGMGHLGMGQPFANAAKLAHPERPVILITGDGAMGCTVQELETAARYGLQTITVVFNDSHWGMYRPLGEGVLDNQAYGTRLTDVDFSAVARGFGCHGERVTALEALPAAFDRARQCGGPALLEIPVDFTPHPMDRFWMDVVMQGVAFEPVTV